MNNTARIIIVLAVLVVVAGVIIAKQRSRSTPAATPATGGSEPAAVDTTVPAGDLPRLVDLGAGYCPACKALKPVVEQLGRDFAGQLVIQTIDINEDPAAEAVFNVELIPTLVFLDAKGAELDRHVGYLSREQILGKWRDLGYDFEQSGSDVGGG